MAQSQKDCSALDMYEPSELELMLQENSAGRCSMTRTKKGHPRFYQKDENGRKKPISRAEVIDRYFLSQKQIAKQEEEMKDSENDAGIIVLLHPKSKNSIYLQNTRNGAGIIPLTKKKAFEKMSAYREFKQSLKSASLEGFEKAQEIAEKYLPADKLEYAVDQHIEALIKLGGRNDVQGLEYLEKAQQLAEKYNLPPTRIKFAQKAFAHAYQTAPPNIWTAFEGKIDDIDKQPLLLENRMKDAVYEAEYYADDITLSESHPDSSEQPFRSETAYGSKKPSLNISRILHALQSLF